MSILSKINVIMGTLPAIGKEGKIVAGNSQVSVRKSDDIFDAVFPLMATHGVVITKKVVDLQQKSLTKMIKAGQAGQYEKVYEYCTIHCEYTFTDTEDNSSITSSSIGCGMDDQDKALAKAQTVALRIALTEVFAIPFHEVDWKDKTEVGESYTKPSLPKKSLTEGARNLTDTLQVLRAECRLLADRLGAKKAVTIAEDANGINGEPIDYDRWTPNQWDLYKTKLKQAIDLGQAIK